MHTDLTELLGCRLPIQLAGMGWVAGPELAAAVADAGGAGTVAPHMLPAPALAPMLDELVARADGPVGFNVLMPFLDLDAVDVAAARTRYVEFFYGDPDRTVVERVHGHGALAAWQVGSPTEAVAAERAGCDFVIAQGIEAGGHVRGHTALLPLLAAVLETVTVPVVAAGGIATARSLAAVLAAGAGAARIGTRFLAATEADVHPAYRDALLRAVAADTELTETFSTLWPDAPHRVLRSCITTARAHTADPVGTVVLGGREGPVPRLGPMAPISATTGDIAAMALYAGQGVDAVGKVQPAAEIVTELTDGARRLLAGVSTEAKRSTS
jgi:nitronate monooxygenase